MPGAQEVGTLWVRTVPGHRARGRTKMQPRRLPTRHVPRCQELVTSYVSPHTYTLFHLRLPPPPPRLPPLLMLDEPRELLARALLPLDPPEPPPNALEFRDPPPPEVLRLPTRSPLPRLALLLLAPAPRVAESLSPYLRSLAAGRSRFPEAPRSPLLACCRPPGEPRSPACCNPPPRWP